MEQNKIKLIEMVELIQSNFPAFHKDDTFVLDKKEYEVVWLMDRQKPSVGACYDFDEERMGIGHVIGTADYAFIVGTDSGCSCPSPWNDNFPECYSVCTTFQEVEYYANGSFDPDWIDECLQTGMQKINAIQLKARKPAEQLSDISIAVGSVLAKHVTLAESKEIVEALKKLGYTIHKT